MNSGAELPPDTGERLESFTELVGTAIANAEAQEGLKELVDEQAALRRVATLVAQGASAGVVMDAVAAQMQRLLSADGVTLSRYEPNEETPSLPIPARTRKSPTRHPGQPQGRERDFDRSPHRAVRPDGAVRRKRRHGEIQRRHLRSDLRGTETLSRGRSTQSVRAPHAGPRRRQLRPVRKADHDGERHLVRGRRALEARDAYLDTKVHKEVLALLDRGGVVGGGSAGGHIQSDYMEVSRNPSQEFAGRTLPKSEWRRGFQLVKNVAITSTCWRAIVSST